MHSTLRERLTEFTRRCAEVCELKRWPGGSRELLLGVQRGELVTHDAAAQQDVFGGMAGGGIRPQQQTLHIADSQPGDGVFEGVERSQRHDGPTKSSVITASGLQVDLRVVEPVAFGAALQYFTGSKEHNVRLRELAVKKGWKLNEWGLFDGERQIAGEDEAGIYKKLGLPFIPPELRELNEGAIRSAVEALLDHVRAGRHDEARELQQKLTPLAKLVTSVHGVPGLKAALDLVGFKGGEPRLPLRRAPLDAVEEIRRELATLESDAAVRQ